MIAVFFAKSDHAAPVSFQERKTVNAEWYINICLPKVFEAWSARHPNNATHDLLLHHNASAHTAAVTVDYVPLVTQTAYSPCLAPRDLFLFPRVKHLLKGKQSQGVKDALDFFFSFLFFFLSPGRDF